MSETDLYRHVCSKCDEEVISDEHEVDECPNCDDKYASMILTPSLEHDKKIMEAPPDSFECPDCGSSLFALSTEDGRDWMCRQSGGCGYAGWLSQNSDIRPPKDIPHTEGYRRSAWSRYKRYQEGHFEYRE